MLCIINNLCCINPLAAPECHTEEQSDEVSQEILHFVQNDNKIPPPQAVPLPLGKGGKNSDNPECHTEKRSDEVSQEILHFVQNDNAKIHCSANPSVSCADSSLYTKEPNIPTQGDGSPVLEADKVEDVQNFATSDCHTEKRSDEVSLYESQLRFFTSFRMTIYNLYYYKEWMIL